MSELVSESVSELSELCQSLCQGCVRAVSELCQSCVRAVSVSAVSVRACWEVGKCLGECLVPLLVGVICTGLDREERERSTRKNKKTWKVKNRSTTMKTKN